MQQFGGEWTVLKLDCLRQYLGQYVQVMKNQKGHFRTHYIDAFAGTGYVELQPAIAAEPGLYEGLLEDSTEAATESERILSGSARLALETDPPFDQFTFIERDPARANELDKLKYSRMDTAHTVQILRKDANAALHEICANWDEQRDRAVLFLDPFATEVEWQTLEAVAGTESMDVWYLFPLMAVNRLLRRDGKLPPEWEQRLNTIFGASDWRAAFYQPNPQRSLYDEVEDSITKVGDPNAIRDYLLARLRATFPWVADNPRTLYNSRNSPLFLLCFAASNPNGTAGPIALRIAGHILRAT